jgi:DNA/RNA-binding domain of Phe-tRNA-synthetase-like protein
MTQAITLTVAAHPLLELEAFVCHYADALGALAADETVIACLSKDAAMPFASDDEVKKKVRDLLRVGGFRPSGRSKPSAEYLIKAAEKGAMRSINAAVDACNAASLHSGLPISVVDLDQARGPFSVAIAEPETRYVFNPSGQVIDVSGLLCLFDAEGPCANSVKDAQRTKTHEGTQRTLSVVWGTRELPGRAAAVAKWYRERLEAAGHRCEPVVSSEG